MVEFGCVCVAYVIDVRQAERCEDRRLTVLVAVHHFVVVVRLIVIVATVVRQELHRIDDVFVVVSLGGSCGQGGIGGGCGGGGWHFGDVVVVVDGLIFDEALRKQKRREKSR